MRFPVLSELECLNAVILHPLYMRRPRTKYPLIFISSSLFKRILQHKTCTISSQLKWYGIVCCREDCYSHRCWIGHQWFVCKTPTIKTIQCHHRWPCSSTWSQRPSIWTLMQIYLPRSTCSVPKTDVTGWSQLDRTFHLALEEFNGSRYHLPWRRSIWTSIIQYHSANS